jgi:hypothetical protein
MNIRFSDICKRYFLMKISLAILITFVLVKFRIGGHSFTLFSNVLRLISDKRGIETYKHDMLPSPVLVLP